MLQCVKGAFVEVYTLDIVEGGILKVITISNMLFPMHYVAKNIPYSNSFNSHRVVIITMLNIIIVKQVSKQKFYVY